MKHRKRVQQCAILICIAIIALSACRRPRDTIPIPAPPLSNQINSQFELKLHPTIPIANIQVPDRVYIRFFHNFPNVLLDMTEFLYTYFADDFDFIAFAYNEDSRFTGSVYGGLYVGVQNDTMGIGERIYDDTSFYGSAGRLQGVMHFPRRNGLTNAGLHEFMHRWANYVLPTDSRTHWSIGTAGGNVGGFDPDSLRHIDGNRYSVDFRYNESFPYSPLELYLAGLIPASEVPDTRVAMNPMFTFSVSGAELVTEGFEVYSIERIIEENGARVPSVQNSQKEFRVLFAVVSSSDLSEEEWAEFDRVTSEFGFAGADGSPNYNFWEATGGRAGIQFGGIAESLIREP